MPPREKGQQTPNLISCGFLLLENIPPAANLRRFLEDDADSLSGPLSGFVVSGPRGHRAGG